MSSCAGFRIGNTKGTPLSAPMINVKNTEEKCSVMWYKKVDTSNSRKRSDFVKIS